MTKHEKLTVRLKKYLRSIFIIFILYILFFELIWNGLLSYFQSEATRGLNTISNAEKGHYQSYASWSENFGDILIGFDKSSKYVYFISPTEYEGRSLEELGLSLPVDFLSLDVPMPGLIEEGFVAVAIGNIDLDDELDIWWIDQNNIPRNSKSDVWSVWKAVLRISKYIQDY